MADGRARERVREELKRVLSQIVEFEARDPLIRSAFPTVMDIHLSVDLRYATVYVALGTPPGERAAVLAAFHRDRGFFRSQLAKEKKLSLRHIPELEFTLDETVERSLRLERLLADEDDALRSS